MGLETTPAWAQDEPTPVWAQDAPASAATTGSTSAISAAEQKENDALMLPIRYKEYREQEQLLAAAVAANNPGGIAEATALKESLAREIARLNGVPPSGEQSPGVPLAASGNIIRGTQPGQKTLSPTELSMLGGGLGLTTGAAGVGAQKSADLITSLYRRAFPKEAYAPRVEPTFGGTSSARAPVNTVAPVAQGVGPGAPAAQSAVAGTPVAQGVSTGALEKVPGHERWLEPRSAGNIPKAFSNEMTTMTGGANVPGSGENILARNAAAVQKVKELGYNPLTMEKYGDILLTEPSKVRPKAPDVWTRTRASGPAPFVARRVAPAPVVSPLPALPATTAPASALPVAAAAAAPEESVLAHIFRKTKPVLAPIAKIGLSGLSGALGANQLYNAEKDREKQGLTFDNSLDYLSGAGGLIGMVPTLPTQLFAAGLQTPAAINALRKYLQYQYEHPEEVKARDALQNVDPMGNPY
jgi:hypothetical protein